MIHDPQLLKLGKRAPKHLDRLPRLRAYTNGLPVAPPTLAWSDKMTALGMMDNDKLGDCTCASAGHILQAWTANASTQFVAPDADVLAMYEGACGYNPADPSTDQGGVESDVLTWWTKNTLAGHKIDAFVQVNPRNLTDIQDAAWLLGGAYLGVALPIACQNQEVWDAPVGPLTGDNAPGSWGGHAVPLVDYDLSGATVITWGARKKLTWRWFAAYCDEAYGLLSDDWFEDNGNVPNGFNVSQIKQDFAAFQAS
jgi:hypothetical protein